MLVLMLLLDGLPPKDVLESVGFWTAVGSLAIIAGGIVAYITYQSARRDARADRAITLIRRAHELGLQEGYKLLVGQNYAEMSKKNLETMASAKDVEAAKELSTHFINLDNYYAEVALLIKTGLADPDVYFGNMLYNTMTLYACSIDMIKHCRDVGLEHGMNLYAAALLAYPYYMKRS